MAANTMPSAWEYAFNFSSSKTGLVWESNGISYIYILQGQRYHIKTKKALHLREGP